MIAVDASALLAIVFNEPEASAFAHQITENDCIVGAPSRFEATLGIQWKAAARHMDELLHILALPNVSIVDFSAAHALVAQNAFVLYGRVSKHKAGLNYGDCMAYAVARVADVPLLFKGEDFVHTDIQPAIRV